MNAEEFLLRERIEAQTALVARLTDRTVGVRVKLAAAQRQLQVLIGSASAFRAVLHALRREGGSLFRPGLTHDQWLLLLRRMRTVRAWRRHCRALKVGLVRWSCRVRRARKDLVKMNVALRRKIALSPLKSTRVFE